jgi:hypothetical protein
LGPNTLGQLFARLIIAHAQVGWVSTIELEFAPSDVMPKRKKKSFRATTAVKAAAREQIGSPPPTRLVPGRKKQTDKKHKPTLGKMLGGGEF